MKKKKMILLLLLGVVIMGWFFGCKKIEESSSSNQAGLSREDLVKLTIEAVDELNQKSKLGDYDILGTLPYAMEIPGSGTMNNGKDSFNCYPYAGGNYITRVFLSSAETDVFGISNGQTEEEVNSVLSNEGYQKLTEEESSHLFRAKEDGIAYSKYDITIAFRFAPEVEAIDKITIIVSDPTAANITY